MKKFIRLVIAAGLLGCAAPFLSTSVAAAEKAAPKGSIRPEGKLKSAELVALTRISFEQALKAALAVVPGSVIKAELEVEDGNLQYSFEIVGTDKKTAEVEIDAGNGKVLDFDKDGID